MSSKDPVQKRFRIVLAGCGLFVIAMLGSLAYVCSRPQTPAIQAAEKQTILACKQQSEDPARTEIFRIERRKACAEMQKQYVHKFKELPA